ncbi:MAG: ATP-binding protein, partial [Gemmataceae bacterium]
MLSPAIRNPFLDIKADHTDKLPPGDVPELHADIYGAMRDAVGHARQIGQGFGLVMVGEAGSGKSHLIARLRKHLDPDPRAVLVTLRMRTGRIGHLWRPVRQQLFEELLKPLDYKSSGANGLLRLLGNRFPAWASSQGDEGGLLNWLIGRKRQADLKPHLDAFARSCPLHHDLLKVLPQLANPDLSSLADQWLRGSQLGEEDLHRLRLAPVFPSEQEREDIAAEVVLSFLRLAGDKTTLALCFDEVEAIQAGNWDKPVLREFATMAVTMLGQPGPRAVITSLRFNLHTELKQATDVTSMQKLATTSPQFMKVLEWEQMLRIVHVRLDAEPTCRAERQHQPPGSDWPLSRQFLETLHRTHKRILTPRHVLQACGEEFTRLQAADVPAATDAFDVELIRAPSAAMPEKKVEPREPADPGKYLSRKWEELAGKYKKLPQRVKFDDVFAKGLPWLAHLTGLPYARSEGRHPGIDDVNLVFLSRTRGQKALGVALCNDPTMNLWRRLDRLRLQWLANKGRTLAGLALLRHAEERTTPGAVERFKALESDG